MWYENYDIRNIVTPVVVEELERLLVESNYDREETKFLVNGFTNGFSLNYHGPTIRRTFCNNHRLKAGNRTVLWNKLMTEVKLKRAAGPWRKEELPFDNFLQSPLNLIEKKGYEGTDELEGTRLIFDLSSPRGESLNDFTPQEYRSVKYPSFDKTIAMCLKEGRGCYLSKTDAKSGFKQIPLAVDQFKWVVMMCEHPESGEKFYFCDKTLCFGSGTSCFLYMKLSNALAHIFRYQTRSTAGDINNFLDDFQTAKLDRSGCNEYLRMFMQICDTINLPLSREKTCYAAREMVFLGLLINSLLQTVSLPVDKVERARRELDILIRSKKTTLNELQKLTGLLNFLCRAIVPGRAFTRRLYAKGKGVLRPYHHLKVDKEMKADCQVWLHFLCMDQAVCRPFLDFSEVWHADQLDYFTDAALNSSRLGVGGRYGEKWFAGSEFFRDSDINEGDINIQIAELYSIFLSLSMWIQDLRNRRVIVFTDNESVMHMINKSSSSCRVCMIMIRLITLWSMRYNVRVFAAHIGTEKNVDADRLSRGKVQEFLQSRRDKPESQELLPEQFWPFPKTWLTN